jgi:LytS/YehU family sensor histidine kinase
MVAPIIQGILSGLCRDAIKKRFHHVSIVPLAFVVGFIAETLQMVLILLLAKPWNEALNLVKLIGFPQTIANSVGVALFFMVYNTIEKEEERIGSIMLEGRCRLQILPCLIGKAPLIKRSTKLLKYSWKKSKQLAHSSARIQMMDL